MGHDYLQVHLAIGQAQDHQDDQCPLCSDSRQDAEHLELRRRLWSRQYHAVEAFLISDALNGTYVKSRHCFKKILKTLFYIG